MTDPSATFGLLPHDEHDRRLLENVHPAGWANPPARGRYDLVVIGAGTAGLVTAAIAVALGARVALVERHLMGGDCLNVGCVPSKAVLRAARSWNAARRSAADFGGPAIAGEGDFGRVMERMRALRAEISAHDSAARFRDLGVDVFIGEGRFTGTDRVEVAGVTLRFRRAVLATGGRPATPDIPGLREAGYLTNETIFSLTELPPRLAIIGGGPIGCEMAQAFRAFGSRVTVIEAAPRLLSHDDPDAAGVVRAALERDGVEVLATARVARVEGANGASRVVVRVDGGEREVEADRILLAAGRTAGVEGVEPEAARVRYNARGVEVDDRLRTSNPRVYAIGDVNGRYAFTHAADAQARLVVQNALFFGRGKLSSLVVPWVTYTAPELAHVGITAEEVERRGEEVETVTVPMREVDRARLEGETEGFLKVYLRRGTDRILGATLVGEHAGEIVTLLTSAMVAGTGLDRLGQAIYPYPTRAEIVRKAADQWRRRKLTPAVKKGFDLFFRLRG